MFGVTYNARVGDRAFGWAGDHVEPGVSIAHPDEKRDFALHYLTCIGNEADGDDGPRQGRQGHRHGRARPPARGLPRRGQRGAQHRRHDPDPRRSGAASRLRGFPQIEFKKTSPQLLQALRPARAEQRRSSCCPWRWSCPIEIMGSGAELNSEYVDQDLMCGRPRADGGPRHRPDAARRHHRHPPRRPPFRALLSRGRRSPSPLHPRRLAS